MYVLVFIFSIFLSLLVLMLERAVGIPWDFHPDSATYITSSTDISEALLNSGNFTDLLNNGFYLIIHLLNSDVIIVTIYNMALFALTNVMIFNILNKKSGAKYFYWGILFILLNPYRIHLATTVLKDTTIIFLIVLSIYKKKSLIFTIPGLLIMRMASIIYVLSILLNGKFRIKNLYYPTITILLIIFFINIYSPERIINWIELTNNTDMVFREFDSVPTFREYGNYGILMRAIFWPLLFQTGLFFLLSPSIAYFPIFLGSIFNLFYCKIYQKTYGILLAPYLGLAIISLFASGFTTYLRYGMPIFTIIPLLIATRLTPSTVKR